jgi:hypothetical protein
MSTRRVIHMAECVICSAAGIVTEATRETADHYGYCDECAREAEHYLQPGERLEDVTRAEIDRRIYGDPW